MTTCPNPLCGAAAPADAHFCPVCGEYLKFDERTGEQPVAAAAAAAAAPAAVVAAPPRPAVTLTLGLPGLQTDPGAPCVLAVDPGVDAVLHANVRNQGAVTDSFTVVVEQIPAHWWRVPAAPLHLNPMAARAADADGVIAITFCVPRAPEAEAGEVPIEIVVRSGDGETAREPATLVIRPFADTTVGVTPAAQAGRRRARFEISATNRGNAPRTVALAAADGERACRTDVSPATCELAPGETATAVLTVRPRKRRWFGRPVEHAVAVSAGDCVVVPATVVYRQRAWLPGWVPPLALLLLALALIVPPLLPKSAIVPDVRGAASPFEAQRLLEPAGLRVGAAPELVPGGGAAPGTVLEQSPAPGERVARGATVTLKVAGGAGTAVVPDVTGKTVPEADSLLAAANLKLGRVTPQIDYEATIDKQLPAQGEKRPVGTPVEVTLRPKAPAHKTAPPVVGTKPAEPRMPQKPAAPHEPAAPLVFDDARNLFILRPGETRPEPLTGGDDATEPAVAADGQTIAYRREISGSGQIYLLHPAQGDAPGQPLTAGDGDYGRPAFLPGGNVVVFIRRADYAMCVQPVTGTPGSAHCVHDRDWAFNRPTVSPSGGSILVLAFRRADPERAGLFEFSNAGPGAAAGWTERGLVMEVAAPQFVAWGPTGTVAVMAGPDSQAAQLLLIPAHGERLDPDGAKRKPVFGCEIAWRADGVLIVANHACLKEIANGPLTVVDPVSGKTTQLGVQGGNPAWQPAKEDA